MNRILTGGRIQHEQRFARRIRQLTGDNAVDLRQFVHQVGLVVQTACRIHDDDIAAACLGRRDGVEHNSRRVCALAVANDVRTGTFSPDFELVRRSRAEGIRRRQHHLFALIDIAGRQLADRGRLADTVDADYQNDRRLAVRIQRLVVEHVVGQHLAEQVAQLVRRGGLAQLGALFDLSDDLRRRGCTDIRQDECFFQFLEQIIIHLDKCREHAVQRVVHRIRCFL